MKLVTLFVIAVTHVIYMSSFLKAFSALVDYADALDGKATASESYSLRHQIELLADVIFLNCFFLFRLFVCSYCG